MHVWHLIDEWRLLSVDNATVSAVSSYFYYFYFMFLWIFVSDLNKFDLISFDNARKIYKAEKNTRNAKRSGW